MNQKQRQAKRLQLLQAKRLIQQVLDDYALKIDPMYAEINALHERIRAAHARIEELHKDIGGIKQARNRDLKPLNDIRDGLQRELEGVGEDAA